jgi:hypothetical protein
VEDSLTPYARTGQDRKARLLAIGGEGAIALYINSWGRLRDNGTTRAKCFTVSCVILTVPSRSLILQMRARQ